MHTFLESGQVSLADLEEVIRLTTAGALRWYLHPEVDIFYNADPADQEAFEAIGSSLRGMSVLMEQKPIIKLKGAHGNVKAGDEIVATAEPLFQLIRRAVSLGGTLKSPKDEVKLCENCGEETPHRRLVDRPYADLPAEYSRTRRTVCMQCEHTVYDE